MSNENIKVVQIDPRHESVNERLWSGEIHAEDLMNLLQRIPADAKIRIYGNKLQAIAPNTGKIFTLDMVED